MNKKQAIKITGGLSNPSKMPCKSYSLPAAECKTGSKLRNKQGSVCSNCYACKGMYKFQNVQKALYRRFESIYDSRWIDAMVLLIGNSEFFRWHDSGDIQGIIHLCSIFIVCENTPNTKHWLPTKEKSIVVRAIKLGMKIPDNLVIRYSMPMINQKPKMFFIDGLNTSHSVSSLDKVNGMLCTAFERENECGTCRACWDRSIPNIAYKMH